MIKSHFRVLSALLLTVVFVIFIFSFFPITTNITIQYQNVKGWLYHYANNFVNQTVVQARQVIQTNRKNEFASLNIPQPELPGVNKTGRYVSMCSGNFDNRRFGNQLFNFAGMVKVAYLTGRRLAMVRNHPHGWLDQIFEVPITRVENIERELCPCAGYGEGDALKNSPPKNDTVGKSLLICGWWQNWKYTEGVEMQLRYYLRLRPEISDEVKSYFTEQHPGHWPRTATPFRVGIHVRAGDIMNARKFGFGYTIPKQSYFQKAMDYVLKNVTPHFKTKDEKLFVHFFVTSDSIDWVQSSLNLTSLADSLVNRSKNEDVYVTYSTNNTAAFDLAMLTLCDTVIMTTGTFGWWAGWLSNKTTIYFHDWPRPGSPLTGAINRVGFFPPWWVSLSGPFYTF